MMALISKRKVQGVYFDVEDGVFDGDYIRDIGGNGPIHTVVIGVFR